MNYRKIIGGMINGLLRPLNLEVRTIRQGSMDIEKEKIKDNVSQTQLFLYYQLLRNMKLPLPKFEDTGFSVYLQKFFALWKRPLRVYHLIARSEYSSENRIPPEGEIYSENLE